MMSSTIAGEEMEFKVLSAPTQLARAAKHRNQNLATPGGLL